MQANQPQNISLSIIPVVVLHKGHLEVLIFYYLLMWVIDLIVQHRYRLRNVVSLKYTEYQPNTKSLILS
jgi:hypothetical protein